MKNKALFPWMKLRIKKQVLTGILWVLWLTVVVTAAFCVSRYWVQLMLIQGDSMMPSFHNLQMVLVDKRVDRYQRGDVVAFYCEELDEHRSILVKRLVALPGDTVQIKEGTLLVNGHISELFPQKGMFDDPGIAAEMILLGEGEYFAIGDNVTKSKDSRFEAIGIVSEVQLIGKIIN